MTSAFIQQQTRSIGRYFKQYFKSLQHEVVEKSAYSPALGRAFTRTLRRLNLIYKGEPSLLE